MHSMVIRSVEWQGMKLGRNDRDEVGMMILVILNTFPSFLSSQMFGKNVVFLDFIPIIPASFRHSGVIPKFHFNWNDAGMTNDFGLKLTTFPKKKCKSQYVDQNLLQRRVKGHLNTISKTLVSLVSGTREPMSENQTFSLSFLLQNVKIWISY